MIMSCRETGGRAVGGEHRVINKVTVAILDLSQLAGEPQHLASILNQDFL